MGVGGRNGSTLPGAANVGVGRSVAEVTGRVACGCVAGSAGSCARHPAMIKEAISTNSAAAVWRLGLGMWFFAGFHGLDFRGVPGWIQRVHKVGLAGGGKGRRRVGDDCHVLGVPLRIAPAGE